MQSATDKQLSKMSELGLSVPPKCSFEQAAEAIGLAQIVLRYVAQIANRDWRIHVEDAELRAVVQAVMEQPELTRQICENMDASAQAAWMAVRDFEDDPTGSGFRRKIERRDVTPDVKEDACYFFAKLQIEKHVPRLAGRISAPPAPPKLESARIFLAQETRWDRLKRNWARMTRGG